MKNKKLNITVMSMVICVLFLLNTFTNAIAAAPSADKLYANAFEAVTLCKNSYTQESINKARYAINQLKGSSASWAIGEFSKQTDMVQQKLFEDFMGLLFDKNNQPKASIPQTDVNKARDLVISFDTYEGNKPYTAAWSSAVDKYQQMLMADVLKLVTNAESTKKINDIATAKQGVNSLLTAKNNQGVINFANGLMTRVNAIVPIDRNYKLAGRAGHNFKAVGSSLILDESTEARKIFTSSFNYLNPVTDFIDCTPYHDPPNQVDDLKYGVNKANSNNADFFYSVHLNKAYSTVQDYAIGSEVWVYDSNSTEAIKKGKAILSNLEKLGFKNRGIKYSKNLFELNSTNSEAIIVECFFLDSKVDTDLYDKLGSDKIGQAIANGLDSRVPFSLETKK